MLSFGTHYAKNPIHWNYFLALEKDLEASSRYVEFAVANLKTYSVEFAHILIAASSEVDVLAKLLCKTLDPTMPRGNIDQYREVLLKHQPELHQYKVWIPRYEFEITPFDNWKQGCNPSWWRSYNNVKHERDVHYSEATLENAITSLAALLLLVTTHYTFALAPLKASPLGIKETTSLLQPESSLLRLSNESYLHAIKFG